MRNPNIKTKVVHSQSKSAWNIIGVNLGGKYKIARLPYNVINDIEADAKHKAEALEHAEYISYCFNNSDIIIKKIESLKNETNV